MTLPFLLVLLRDLVVPTVATGVVIVFASLVSRGTLHRADRIGSAAVAVGFAVGYQAVIGGGFDPADYVSVLPLVGVVAALLAPRIATRVRFGATVGLPLRVGIVVAGLAAAGVLHLVGQAHLAGLALVTVGTAWGLALGAHVGDRESVPLVAPDARPGAWAVVAGMLVAVCAFAAVAVA